MPKFPRFLLVSTALALLATYFLRLEATVCWKRPYCNCYEGEKPTIYCRYVRNVSDVEPLLRKYSPIYKVHLQGTFRTLSSLTGISVFQLWLKAPVGQDVPDDALLGIQNLHLLVLNGTVFNWIPDAFLVPSLRSFRSVQGGVTDLIAGGQNNLSFLEEFDLSRNLISNVSPDAFLGWKGVRSLTLSRNEIASLHPATFEPMLFLEDVDLSYNRLLTMDGCFAKMNPKSINLYGNNLSSFDNVLHQGMWNLKYLNLGGNRGITLTPSTFNATLRSLMALHLSGDAINSLDSSIFRNLWNLHYLYLNNNELSSLSRYFLEHTQFLTTLKLSDNRLESVFGLLEGIRMWSNSLKLILDGNELTSASLGKSRVNIYRADFSRNRISDIRAEDMKRLNAAVRLNFSRNDIGFLEEECFSNFRSLEYLDISHNPLTTLNHTIRNLPKLYELHLRSCLLETLTEEDFMGCQRVKYVNLGNNSLSSVHGAFRNMKYISVLDVSENNLTTLTADSFPPFEKISIRVRTLYMASNPWSCDCRLAWFADWVKRKGSRLMDEPVCSSPPRLRGLPLRSLNRTDLEAWTTDCPRACECLCVAEDLQMHTEVRCLHRGLKQVPRTLPANVWFLDLRGNVIESFDGHDLLHLEQLERLNLENNRMREVRLVLPPKLLSLRLAYNSLRTFPMNDDGWTSNLSITLSRNPWTCNCDTLHFKNWLILHNESIVDLQEVRCGSQESFSLRNKPIILLTKKDLCSYLSSIIIISGCSVFLLIVFVICICYRQSLLACLYSWGCGCLKKSQTQDYPYDAFIMYSEDDENLALGEIATGLESGRHKYLLCIPTRDIPSPRTPQKVSAYLPQCTKVIVLLTRKFIESQECMRLLISAMSFSTESSSQIIIFITFRDLPPTRELDPALKTLLKSCAHLRWGQCLFWQRLKYHLPTKRDKDIEYNDVEEEPLME